MVSHANLRANAGSIAEGFRHPRQAWAVTWLPPYHDMGLMGGLLQPIYCDAPSVVMSPMDFVRQPIVWLEAVSRYRARTSGGPNFAFDLCARSIKPEQSSPLRLDCWELAYTGAEPVRAETLDRFANAFAHTGFRREFFFPCYGLAEATLYVSGGRLNTATVSAEALRLHRVVERPDSDSSETDSDTRQLVGGGQPASTLKVAIVDQETELACEAGCIGEIRVSGPGVAAGYWNRIEETQRAFETRLDVDSDGTYLRTGDLGFMRNGELFVTGRTKDLIIVRGQNHYPQDIENTVASVSASIRPGSCVAFSVDSGNEEKLVLVLEMPRPKPEDPRVLGGDIRQAVAATHELQVSSIVLVRPSAIPRTSSGKLQRHECRAQYVSGALQSLAVI
jgi:acyl-CoA synthetase (AMP-forming)/AMP-acid ligase II